MFLFERIIGITVFTILFILIFSFISNCKTIKQTKKILIFYVVSLSIIGYFYYPYKTADLYYIYNLINTNLIYKNFQDIIVIFKDTGYSLYYVYYWIFGKIGVVHLLPSVTVMFFYSNVFYILYKSCEKFDLSPKTMSKTLLFFMAGGQFLEVASGIKSMFALSIVALCCYKEFVEKKSFISNAPLYLMAALIHDAALIAVGFRLFYLIFQKENKWIIKFRNILLFIIFALFSIKYGGGIIQGATSKGQGYINGNVYSNIWEYIIAFICDLFMIYSVVLIRKIKKLDLELNDKMNKLLTFVTILLLIDMIFIFEYSIFHRYRTFIMIIIIPIVAILLEKAYKKEYKFLKNYNFFFRVYFFFNMGLSLIRGNLSSLKFFELNG